MEEPDAGRVDFGRRGQTQPPESVERLVVGEPGGDDSDPGVRRVDRDAVEIVVDAVARRQRKANLAELALDLEHPRPEEVGRGFRVPDLPVHLDGRHGRRLCQNRKLDGTRAIGDGRDDLHRGPQAGGSGDGDGVQTKLEAFGDRARIQDGHVQIDQGGIRRGRHRRGFACGIIADEDDCTTLTARPREHAMTQRVSGPVEPRCLAVPVSGDTVIEGIAAACGELGTHDRSGGELLIDRWLMHDREIGHEPSSSPELEVKAPEGRPGVSGNEGRGVAAGGLIGTELFDRKTGQGLDTGQQDGALDPRVAVGECIVGLERHRRPPLLHGKPANQSLAWPSSPPGLLTFASTADLGARTILIIGGAVWWFAVQSQEEESSRGVERCSDTNRFTCRPPFP